VGIFLSGDPNMQAFAAVVSWLGVMPCRENTQKKRRTISSKENCMVDKNRSKSKAESTAMHLSNRLIA
jgi:hypothetical protein